MPSLANITTTLGAPSLFKHLNFHFAIILSISPEDTRGAAAATADPDPDTFAPFIFWRLVMSHTMLTMREREWAATDDGTST